MNCDTKFYNQMFVKVIITGAALTSVIVLIIYNTNTYNYVKWNFVAFTQFTWKSELDLMDVHSKLQSLELLELTNRMQGILNEFEGSHDCSTPALVCGNFFSCGLGCQVHHRIICLMMAFALNRTLIHNYIYKWPYKKKWPDMFQHLTTRCKIRPNTLIVNLQPNPPEIKENGTGKVVKFPFENGILVPSEINEALKKLHSFPFLWWIGQFARFTIKLTLEQEQILNDTKQNIGFQSPIVGIHVRRTDKIEEQNRRKNLSVFHHLYEYMDIAESFYYNMKPVPPQPWRIFVASEDTNVFEELKSVYGIPKWDLISTPPNVTTLNWLERKAYLYEIVRDVTLLSQCDFVVCGFASNVCRLVYELMQTRDFDATDRVYSLDFKYSYTYSTHVLNQTVIKGL